MSSPSADPAGPCSLCKGVASQRRPAGRFYRRLAIFAAIAVAGVTLDLWTKSAVFAWLGNPLVMEYARPPVWLLPDVMGETLGVETHVNEGALFGMGQGQQTLFAGLSVVAVLAVGFWLVFGGGVRSLTLTVALGAVCGGIFGNLYDRVGLPGLTWQVAYAGHAPGDPVYAVRDWIHFKIDAIGFDWPIFNIADSLLVCGAGLLILASFFAPQEAQKKDDAERRPVLQTPHS